MFDDLTIDPKPVLLSDYEKSMKIFDKYKNLFKFNKCDILDKINFIDSATMMNFQYSYFFVQMMACLSIIIGLTFHTVVLIFVLMVINNMQVKYTKKYGTPLNLPNKYKNKLELIKRLMIASFWLGIVILYILFYYNNDLNHNFTTIMKYFNIIDIIKYKTLFFALSVSLSLIGISSYQVYIGNTLTQLTRQQLMDNPK
jgi:hypothetical protein